MRLMKTTERQADEAALDLRSLVVTLGCTACAAVCAAIYPFAGDWYGVVAAVGLTAGASAVASGFAWVSRAAMTSDSASVRFLETLRSYLADEPASYERPEQPAGR